MLLTLAFIVTALLFVAGAISALWHLRWVHRLPAMSTLPVRNCPPFKGRIRCSVIVPARNEEARIEGTVRRLLAQRDVDLEIIVVNDRSSDKTGDIVRQLARDDSRVRLISVDRLPDGWLGKCHACYQGAAAATGDWILFADGDCWLRPDVITRAIRVAQQNGTDHVTLTSGLSSDNPNLRACHLMFLISIANWISGVNRDRARSFLGIGAFNLVRAAAYRECGGYQALRLTVLDDVKLGLLLRRAGKRTRAFLGAGDSECHWGTNVFSMIRIMEKNYFAALDFRVLLSVALCTFLTVLVCLIVTGLASRTAAGVAAALSPFSFVIPAAILSRRTGWRWSAALRVPLVIPIFMCALANSTYKTIRRGGIRWRDTFYPLAELRAGAVTWKSPVPACTTPVAHPAIEPRNHSPSSIAP